MRFRLRHLSDREGRVVYGYDGPSGLGFYAHARLSGGEVRYDAGSPGYNHERPLDGVLRWLAAQGFYDLNDLEEALVRLTHEQVAEMPRRCGRIARVVVNLKRAAD